jgi:tight adherence protein B
LTGWILSFLPIVLGALLFMLDPEHMSLLWRRPIGVRLLYTASGMMIAGALMIRKIIRIRV